MRTDACMEMVSGKMRCGDTDQLAQMQEMCGQDEDWNTLCMLRRHFGFLPQAPRLSSSTPDAGERILGCGGRRQWVSQVVRRNGELADACISSFLQRVLFAKAYLTAKPRHGRKAVGMPAT